MRACEVCGHRYHDRAGRPLDRCPFDGGLLVELPDAMEGSLVGGRFRIGEKLGQGGFGAVYRATHEVVGREVAVKFLLPEHAADPRNRERFLREAKAANRINHEHIIDIVDYGESDDGNVYLVMELLEGKALGDEVALGPLSVSRALHVARQCASALGRAHELEVIHRDIKPDNIFLAEHNGDRDYVKLLDFGLAHMKGELRLTATGAVFGTPEYMSPEQARGARVTSSSDLYALGCVLFEMLTGKPPFEGNTADLILKHMREPAPRPSSRVPGVPAALDDLVAKLLEKEPSGRHRDAFHVLEDLRRVADAMPALRTSIPVTSDDATKPRERRRTNQAPVASAQLPIAWERRAELFGRLATRAYGGRPPIELAQQIGDLARIIARVRAVESDISRSAELTTRRESELRSLRLDLGRAVDELGRDESRTVGRIEELERIFSGAEHQHRDAQQRIVSALQTFRSGAFGTKITQPLARALVDLGDAARGWIESDETGRAVKNERVDRQRELEDLRFQISQLKGRLASMVGDRDRELEVVRGQSGELDRARRLLLDEATQRAAAISNQLARFPELHEQLFGEAPTTDKPATF